MPRTFDVGPFYVHGLRYPFRGAPPAERAWTTEVEPPFRRGSGWAFRVGPRLAVVVGKWSPSGMDEDEALMAALGAAPLEVDVKEVAGWRGGAAPAP